MIGPGDTIELRPIKLGRNLGTEVEVVQGLKLWTGWSTALRIRSPPAIRFALPARPRRTVEPTNKRTIQAVKEMQPKRSHAEEGNG